METTPPSLHLEVGRFDKHEIHDAPGNCLLASPRLARRRISTSYRFVRDLLIVARAL